MRKILLATTAIVAMSAGSAMAADITITGSFEFGYNDDSTNFSAASNNGTALTNGDGTSYTVEQDVTINMSNTTDSGLTMSMIMGLDESGGNDDATALLSADFGTLRFTSLEDDAVEALDVDVDAATSEEGTPNPSGNTPDDDAPVYAGGFSGTGGTSFSYTLPTFVEGLTISAASQNGAADADSTAYGASYTTAAGGASVTLAVASSTVGANGASDTSRNHYGISVTSGDVTIMGESNNMDDGSAADYSSTGVGGTYTMGAVKLGAYTRSASTGTATEDYSQTAYGLDYTIASGLVASITQTSTDKSSTINVERTRASLKMTF